MSYRHPKAEVYERYRQLGIRRLRTDASGALLLHLGSGVRVREYRKEHARYWYPETAAGAASDQGDSGVTIQSIHDSPVLPPR